MLLTKRAKLVNESFYSPIDYLANSSVQILFRSANNNQNAPPASTPTTKAKFYKCSKETIKGSKEYQKRNTVESNSIHLLDVEGKSLKAGEILEYVITDYYETQSKNRRAIPIELINENTTSYDVRRYVELLAETCNSVIEPFGFTVVV